MGASQPCSGLYGCSELLSGGLSGSECLKNHCYNLEIVKIMIRGFRRRIIEKLIII